MSSNNNFDDVFEEFSIEKSNRPFESLEGKVLIASPSLRGSVFEKSLIYIASHDEDGAVGVIFNQQIGEIGIEEVLEYYNIKSLGYKFGLPKNEMRLFFGGPVDVDKAVVLSMTKEQEENFDRLHKLSMRTDVDNYLIESVKWNKKEKFIIARGFCSWGGGQLEQEVSENAWLITKPTPQLIFSNRIKDKWSAVIKDMGASNMSNLVSYSGNT
jgi:putative transcriptional regulator